MAKIHISSLISENTPWADSTYFVNKIFLRDIFRLTTAQRKDMDHTESMINSWNITSASTEERFRQRSRIASKKKQPFYTCDRLIRLPNAYVENLVL